MGQTKITHIWFQPEHYSQVCDAIIPRAWCARVEQRNERRGWETYPKWTGGSPLHILETVCAQFGDAVITCSWPEKQ